MEIIGTAKGRSGHRRAPGAIDAPVEPIDARKWPIGALQTASSAGVAPIDTENEPIDRRVDGSLRMSMGPPSVSMVSPGVSIGGGAST